MKSFFSKFLSLRFLLIISILLNVGLAFRYVRKTSPYKYAESYIIKLIHKENASRELQPELVLALYQLMKDTHEILEDYDIRYWADGGTLLGAVRHQGFIPWDDDLDISIPIEDETKLQEAFKEFEALGYHVQEDKFSYKVSIEDPKKWRGPTLLPPVIDIFVMYKDEDVYKYRRYFSRKFFSYVIPEHYIGERKLSKFGDIRIWIPENPEPILDVMYPKGWVDVAYLMSDHVNKTNLSNVKFSPKAYSAAYPTGPLQNRYSRKLR